MIYKGFDITVKVYAYTECTLDDDGEVDLAIDTTTDFEDIIEYISSDEHGNVFYFDSIKEMKSFIDKHIEENGND